MTASELREAIERPACKVGDEVQPELTERLLADVLGRPGALPLLQFALKEIWRKRDVHRLTLDAYNELGKVKGVPKGIEGVLENRANAIYNALSPADQALFQKLLLRLVQPGEGAEDTKRRVPYRELIPADPAARVGPQVDPDPLSPRRPPDHRRRSRRRSRGRRGSRA